MIRLVPYALIGLMAAAHAWGQLGPADGRKLSPYDLERVRAGEAAPDFRLESGNGKVVSLSEFRGQPVVLVFYRGYW